MSGKIRKSIVLGSSVCVLGVFAVIASAATSPNSNGNGTAIGIGVGAPGAGGGGRAPGELPPGLANRDQLPPGLAKRDTLPLGLTNQPPADSNSPNPAP